MQERHRGSSATTTTISESVQCENFWSGDKNVRTGLPNQTNSPSSSLKSCSQGGQPHLQQTYRDQQVVFRGIILLNNQVPFTHDEPTLLVKTAIHKIVVLSLFFLAASPRIGMLRTLNVCI